jgi:erythromycin esterase-like protein
MAAVIPDEMIDEVAVVAPIDHLGEAIRARYGDRVQRVGYYAFDGGSSWSSEEWAHLIATTRG